MISRHVLTPTVRGFASILRVSWRESRALSVVVLVFAVLDALKVPASAVVTGAIVGSIRAPGSRLAWLLAIYGVVQAFPAGEVRWRMLMCLSARVGIRLDARVLEALDAPAGIAHLEDPDVRDQMSRAVTFWNSSVLEGTVNVAVLRMQGAFAAIVVASRLPAAGLLLAGMWLAYGRWARHRMRAVTDVLFDSASGLRETDYLCDLALEPAAAKEVRVFGLRRFLGHRFVERWTQTMAPLWTRRRTSAGAVVTAAVAIVAVHAFAFLAVARGALSIGTATAVVQAILATSGLAIGTFGGWEVEYGLRTVAANAELHRALHSSRFEMPGVRATDGMPSHEIRFERVAFRYPGRHRDVLRGVDLVVPAGTSLAVVGANGAGKTTLLKVLCRFYDPSAGRVLVDGVDLRELDPRAWHQRIAAVLQDFLHYPLTAAENIGFARDPERAAVTQAAERAGALAVLEGLSRGLDTTLTREVAGGADLSGGEWQRVALARALYAVDAGAGVLLLDEPTAHLDARAEADLYDRFLDVARGATTIVVSHRFSTVRRADRIVVLDDGVVAEHGTHDELLSAGGRYATMFRLQASRFEHA